MEALPFILQAPIPLRWDSSKQRGEENLSGPGRHSAPRTVWDEDAQSSLVPSETCPFPFPCSCAPSKGKFFNLSNPGKNLLHYVPLKQGSGSGGQVQEKQSLQDTLGTGPQEGSYDLRTRKDTVKRVRRTADKNQEKTQEKADFFYIQRFKRLFFKTGGWVSHGLSKSKRRGWAPGWGYDSPKGLWEAAAQLPWGASPPVRPPGYQGPDPRGKSEKPKFAFPRDSWEPPEVH